MIQDSDILDLPTTRDGVEMVDGPLDARLLLTCEHADNRLPERWRWPVEDAWVTETHWAYDIGAAQLTHALAARAHAPAVLARFSRLLIDPNRPLSSDTLFRSTAEGRPVHLNQTLTSRDRERRIRYWDAYHGAVAAHAGQPTVDVIFSVHSFTPEYEGARRDFEVGVLFDTDESLANEVARALSTVASTRLNEPYSGKAGLIYSAQRHAHAFGRRAVEIEVRQDRILDPSFCEALIGALLPVLP